VNDLILYAILGLGGAGVLTLLAQGIVLIYRGAGVLNLAHGAYAMLGAYFYLFLRQNDLPAGLAIPVAVLAVALLGLVTDQTLLRWLRHASALTRLVATMGVLLLIQSIVVLVWDVTPRTTPPIIAGHQLHAFGGVIPLDRIWLFAIAVAVTFALTIAWRYTRWGWVAEATSEDQRLIASLGWSPEVVSSATWSFGAGLAALAGILVAPITQLNTTGMPLLVVPALAAALIGRFRSFPLTLFGATIIGIGQSEVSKYVHFTGASDALPLVVIIVGLTAKGSALPLRGQYSDRLPRVGSGRVRWYILLPVSLLIGLTIPQVSSYDWQSAIGATCGVGLILLSFVVVIGYTGQLSLAQYSLAGFGALFAARAVTNGGFPFWCGIIVGSLGSSIIGIVFALPALRTRGVNLAVVTLGLAVAAQSMVFDNSTFAGPQEGISPPPPTLLGIDLDPFVHLDRYSEFAFISLILACLGVAGIRRSAWGRMLLAVRDNERAAAANGISVVTSKVFGFALGGALAGLGGIVLAFQQAAITFTSYDPISGVSFLAEAVIGGVGFLFGPVFGATISQPSIGSLVSIHWQSINLYLPLISSLLLLATVASNPNGWVYGVLRPIRSLLIRLRPASAVGSTLNVVSPGSEVAPVSLSVEALTVKYGGTTAVDEVSLIVRPGQVVGLIGPNGAGKTSFLDAVTGFAAHRNGIVRLNDAEITDLRAHRRVRSGLTRSFQGLELYSDMSVRENVLTASESRRPSDVVGRWLCGRSGQLPAAGELSLHDFGLGDTLDLLPEHLSYGQRRLLAIARAVAASPSVLLLDEPVAGLDDVESGEFAAAVRHLAQVRGMSILLVEHDMDFIMSVCDHIVVIDFGRKVSSGSPVAVRQDRAAIAAYLGEEIDEERERLGTHADS
jgi:ABC-type branched-subunit amino acid transport system ATPase component/branched-subunit amino acid ABC-type transport system permease component